MGKYSFELIYELYFDQVYRYLLSITKDEDLAEDITSETFMKALLNIDRFDQKSKISTWLISIAKNTYLSYLRKNKKIVDFDVLEQSILSDRDFKLDKLIDKEDASSIYKCVHSLDEPYKEVFLLRVLGELSFKEIAKIFDKSDNWACVTYHRAKRKIIEKGDYDES